MKVDIALVIAIIIAVVGWVKVANNRGLSQDIKELRAADAYGLVRIGNIEVQEAKCRAELATKLDGLVADVKAIKEHIFNGE